MTSPARETTELPTLDRVFAARSNISRFALRSPAIPSPDLSEQCGRPVYLKLETLQPTRSFKIRGAANRMLEMTPEERTRGVITFSAGNHGKAVAFMAKQLGIPAVVCLSERVPKYRVQAIIDLGAEVVVHGDSQDEAVREAVALNAERGLTWVHAFDDPSVIAGQGTIGIELIEDLPSIGTVVVPVSGGGLAAGVAMALKSCNRSIRVIGVSIRGASAMHRSLEAGRPVEVAERDTIADALLGGIGLANEYTFRMVQSYVDDLVLVSDEEIENAIRFAARKEHLVLEGAGAVAIAAVLTEKVKSDRGCVALVLSGANIDNVQLQRLLCDRA